jgi:hypothetical protein
MRRPTRPGKPGHIELLSWMHFHLRAFLATARFGTKRAPESSAPGEAPLAILAVPAGHSWVT